jgi:carboxyl-terminal processing protease
MRVRAIVASLLFGSALGAGGWWLRQERVEALPVLEPVLEPDLGARLFEQVQTLIATRYVDSIPADSIYRKAIAGLVDELNDPYSSFLPERRMQRLSEQMSGHYAGVGMQLDLRDGWLTVIEPVPGAPADRAGVQAGDRVVAIEGESTRGYTNDEGVRLLRGEPGSTVSFTLERFGASRFTVKVARESVARRAVPRVVMLRPDVGYVDVNLFGATTVEELRTAIDSLTRQGARGLLIDLRGNPGGLLEQGVAMAELFLDPSQRIVELRGRPGSEPEVVTDREPQPWPRLAVAVLVDGNSASASEIVAGALQDHDRAIVVGRTSFGKGSAQSVFPMTTGGALRLTTARWYTPLGRSISPLVDTGPNAETEVVRSRVPADTIRPRYVTPMGRTVLGGGGIVPDVAAGDTALPKEVQAFVRALGDAAPRYRDAVASVALRVKQRGVFAEPLQPVTRDMVNAVWDEIERRKIAVTRAEFDAAAPWIARALGYESARVAFGPEAEFLRRSQDDPTIARALRLLNGASTPREPFARAEDPGILVPMREPTIME